MGDKKTRAAFSSLLDLTKCGANAWLLAQRIQTLDLKPSEYICLLISQTPNHMQIEPNKAKTSGFDALVALMTLTGPPLQNYHPEQVLVAVQVQLFNVAHHEGQTAIAT